MLVALSLPAAKERAIMSLTMIVILILLAVFLFGGGGYYWSRR